MPSNILWLMTDEQRVDSMGVYGSPWAHTPHLDAVAASGVRFDAAYTPSPVCAPARASLLTGRAGSRIGILNNHHELRPENASFLTEAFARAGYRVASFGKQHYNCKQRAFPSQGGRVLDDKVHYFEYRVPVDVEEHGVVIHPGPRWHWILAGRFPGEIEETAEMENVRVALQWLRETAKRKPFFLRVSFNAPHTPVVAPAPFDAIVNADAIDLPVDDPNALDLPSPVREHLCDQAGLDGLSEADISRARQCYFGRVAFLDEAYRRLLAGMEEAGLLENTIIVFVSDHGAHLGDHGFVQKQSFYEASARVPFFVAGPGIVTGSTIETPVNIGSLLPTLMELCGLEAPGQVDYPSLADCLRTGAEPAAEPIISEIDFGIWQYRDGDRYVMVRDGEWKLALFRHPREPDRFGEEDGVMLHNLRDDPGERSNLARNSECIAIRRRLMALIDAWDSQGVAIAPTRREGQM